jgi:outer membrane protein
MLRRTLLISGILLSLAGPALANAASATSSKRLRDQLRLSSARPTPAREGKSLSDIYALALKRAETVQIQDEAVTQADELVSQAKGSMLPNVSASALFLKQEAPSSALGDNISPSDQSTVRLTAIQPLFRGFRDFAVLRQRKTTLSGQKLALQEAARQLLSSTAAAYYSVLALESDVYHFENQIALNQKRVQELEGYVRIGRSQKTDVLTLRSNISSLEATLEATRGNLESARETLAYYSGTDRALPISDNEALPAQIEPLPSFLARLEERPDVQTAKATVEATEEGVPIARGQHWPSLDLQGDYYLKRSSKSLEGVDWSLQLGATLPIFQGGVISSQTRVAASATRQSELTLSRTRRAAELEIRQLYDSYVTDQRLLAKLAEAASLGQKSYEALSAQYRTGLSTNLDVLQSQAAWHDSLRLLSRQQYTAKADYVRLQAATGARPEIRIESTKTD